MYVCEPIDPIQIMKGAIIANHIRYRLSGIGILMCVIIHLIRLPVIKHYNVDTPFLVERKDVLMTVLTRPVAASLVAEFDASYIPKATDKKDILIKYFPYFRRGFDTPDTPHKGLDFNAPINIKNAYVAFPFHYGLVVFKETSYAKVGHGCFIAILCLPLEVRSDGQMFVWILGLSHMAGPAIVPLGQFVTAGQSLGIMGSTGSSTGVHVHVGLSRIPLDVFKGVNRQVTHSLLDKYLIDPEPYIVLPYYKWYPSWKLK